MRAGKSNASCASKWSEGARPSTTSTLVDRCRMPFLATKISRSSSRTACCHFKSHWRASLCFPQLHRSQVFRDLWNNQNFPTTTPAWEALYSSPQALACSKPLETSIWTQSTIQVTVALAKVKSIQLILIQIQSKIAIVGKLYRIRARSRFQLRRRPRFR